MPSPTPDNLAAFLAFEPAAKDLEKRLAAADNLDREAVARIGMDVIAEHWCAWEKTTGAKATDPLAEIHARLDKLESLVLKSAYPKKKAHA